MAKRGRAWKLERTVVHRRGQARGATAKGSATGATSLAVDLFPREHLLVPVDEMG